MTKFSRRIFENCRFRRTSRQKREFRHRLTELFYDAGYPVFEERFGILRHRVNLVIGDADSADTVVTTRLSNKPTLLMPNLRLPKSKFFHYLYRFVLCVLLGFLGFFAEDLYFQLTQSFGGSLAVFFILTAAAALLWFFGPTFSRHANDNASGVITAIDTLRTFRPEDLDKYGIAFVFLDDGSVFAGGASAFLREHPDCEDALVIHLDAMGYGDHFLFACSEELREDAQLCEEVIGAIENHPHKSNTVSVGEKCVLPADARVFEKNVCISSYTRGLFGILFSFRNRTPFDKKLDQTNLSLITRFIQNVCGGNHE